MTLLAVQLLAIVLEETRLTPGKWKKEGFHRLRMRLKFLLNVCDISRYYGTHLIPVTTLEKK